MRLNISIYLDITFMKNLSMREKAIELDGLEIDTHAIVSQFAQNKLEQKIACVKLSNSKVSTHIECD